MLTTETEQLELQSGESERDRVVRWRSEELERVGYDRISAGELAGRMDVDLHVAKDLLRRGCSIELALQILC